MSHEVGHKGVTGWVTNASLTGHIRVADGLHRSRTWVTGWITDELHMVTHLYIYGF